MPNITRSALFLPALAGAATLVLCVGATAAPTPPQYAWQTITPLGAPGEHVIPARIIAFDADGRGYGYSLTGADGATVAAVRWANGTLAPLQTPVGTADSHAAAVTEGAVIGWARSARGSSTGLMWSGDEVLQIGDLLPLAVGPRGVVAGVIRNPVHPGRYAPALWRDGSVTPLPMNNPEAHGWVVGISDRGEVAGSWFLHGGPSQAVRWTGGVPQVLALPDGARASEARDMNAAGMIVGWADFDGGRTAALLWNGDAVVDLGVLDPATPRVWADSINAHGHVVGIAETPTGRTAFLWDGTAMHDLRDLIAAATGEPLSATDDLTVSHLVIGDTGHIAGVRYFADGTAEPFVLVPVPTPGTLVLGVLAMVPLARRRR